MNMISASDLKTSGVSAIVTALKTEQDVVISVQGKPRFVVIEIAYYQELREYELKIALQDAKEDIAAGRYVIETAEEHINRMTKDYGLSS